MQRINPRACGVGDLKFVRKDSEPARGGQVGGEVHLVPTAGFESPLKATVAPFGMIPGILAACCYI